MQHINKKRAILAIFSTLLLNLSAQNASVEKLDIKLETVGTFTDGDYAPFWLTNNVYGIGSDKTNKEYLRAGAFGSKTFFDNKLNVKLGADMLVSHNLQSDFYFQQLYADFEYKAALLSIGAKEWNNPLKNKYLSTGSMTLSNNSRPIPQVGFSIPEFVDIPYTNGLLQFQGGLSYGWYGDNDYKKRHAGNGDYALDVLYHRKYGFIKFENKSPWSFIFGLEMDTQWGGDFYRKGEYVSGSKGNLKNFLKVLMPMSGGGSDSNSTDQVNIVGNVYGSWHFVANYKTKDFTIKGYHEHFFEDHSGVFFKNIPDGVYGLELNFNKKQPISSVLFEYVHTKDQSGPFLWDKTENINSQVSAGDNYYNQWDYISETNYGYTMGNPLLTSPLYNKGRTLSVLNNRISAFHGGLSGYVSDNLQYRALITYSRSWGTHLYPARQIRNQFSSMIEAIYTHPKLNGWQFSGAFAYDDSALMVGDNTGVQFKVSKQFSIK